MLNESLAYIIHKTEHIYDNDALYLNNMCINSLTELIQKLFKTHHTFRTTTEKIITDIESEF